MPVNDILAQTTRELLPVMVDNYSQHYPAMEMFFQGDGMEWRKAGGPTVEFSIWRDGPGKSTHIATGSESYGGTRRQIAETGTVHAARVVYSFDIPRKDLAEAQSDKTAAGKFLKRYHESAVSHMLRMMETQFLVGNQLTTTDGAGFGALVTLNGDVTGLPVTGMTQGLLEFAAAASQTRTASGIVKQGGASGVTEWYNQFPTDGNVTSWGLHGYKRTKNAYYKARARAMDSKFRLLSDLGSFENYEEELLGKKRYGKVGDGEAGAEALKGLAFADAGTWYPCLLLDDTDAQFTTLGSQGICYGLSEKHWKGFTLAAPEDGTKEEHGFCLPDMTKVPRQDVFEQEIIIHLGLYMDRANAQFALAGTKNA